LIFGGSQSPACFTPIADAVLVTCEGGELDDPARTTRSGRWRSRATFDD
jgi:hypothetical protein